jgi:hypothetical protein
VLRPLWGLPPKGHDTLLHYYRIPQINALLRQGILFSRWAPDLFLGYGYPLFNFYPPLSTYLLTAAYWLAGQNAPAGLNLAFGFALLLACLGMFLLGRELYGVAGGLFAAAAYGLSPHLLYQTFQRGSIANALAMGLFPLATLALVRAVRVPGPRRVAWASVLLAGVFLSHTSASLMFAAPHAALGLAAVIGAERGRDTLSRRLGAAVLSLAGGLALAAFVWLPALSEIRFTQYAQAISPGVDYRAHFAELLTWPQPLVAGSVNPHLPRTVGLGQLALGSAALGLSMVGAVGARRSGCLRALRPELLTIACAAMGLATALLGAPPSAWVWERVALLRYLQFPWRFLDVSGYLLPLACGRVAAGRGARSWLGAVMLGAGLVLFVANAVPYTYPPRWRSLPTRPTLADATEAQLRFGIDGLTSWGEYTPATVPQRPQQPPFDGADLGATLDRKLRRDALPDGALLAADGGPLQATFHLNLPEETTLTLDTFYFPGWQARVDERSVPVGPDAEGRLSVAVPAGEHTVAIRFGSTPVRLAADGLSTLAALMAVLALAAPSRWFERRRPGAGSQVTLHPPDGRAHATPCVFAVLAVLLPALTAVRLVWLDHLDSLLVIHLREGRIPQVTAPPWGDYAGELRLAGYLLAPPNRLTLFWQAGRSPSQDYRILVTVADARGVPVKEILNTHQGHNLTSRWEPSDIVRDEYILPLDNSQQPIGYRLSVAVINPLTGEKLSLLDAPESTVRDVPVGTTRLPAPRRVPEGAGHPVQVTFADAIELAQARVPETVMAGQPLEYTLVWRSLRPVTEDYTVFVHLLAPDGTWVDGDDGQPRRGLYPTSYWSPGEIIVDERSWQPAVPPGDYLLQVGLYNLHTGQRLPAKGEGVEAEGSVILGWIRVTG